MDTNKPSECFAGLVRRMCTKILDGKNSMADARNYAEMCMMYLDGYNDNELEPEATGHGIKNIITNQKQKEENMSSLAQIYIKKETMETIVRTLNAKGVSGIGITIGINDDSDQYGNNVAAWVSQTKEDREAKKPRYYVGNGAVYFTKDGTIRCSSKPQNPNNDKVDIEKDDLPF